MNKDSIKNIQAGENIFKYKSNALTQFHKTENRKIFIKVNILKTKTSSNDNGNANQVSDKLTSVAIIGSNL